MCLEIFPLYNLQKTRSLLLHSSYQNKQKSAGLLMSVFKKKAAPKIFVMSPRPLKWLSLLI